MTEKLPRGMAKVQFVAIKDIIKTKFDEGYNITLIYNELRKEEKFTSSFRTFSRYLELFDLKPPKPDKTKNKKKLSHSKNTSEKKEQQEIQQPQKTNSRPELNEKEDFINHDYDPIGGESTENKGDNK